MRRLLLLFVLLFSAGALRAQAGAPPLMDAAPGPQPSTAPAPGSKPSSGAPTLATPDPAPQQAIPFNHKLHVETAKLQCKDCHAPSRTGETLAMPQPTQCMVCHSAIATDKPDIQRLADMAKNNQNAAWVRVYRVPSFVSFSHKTHTDSGATCQDCHGEVAGMTAIAKVKDISMGGCISCHTAKSAPTGCDTCHQLNSVHLERPAADRDAALVAALTHRPAGASILTLHRFLMPLGAGPALAMGMLTP